MPGLKSNSSSKCKHLFFRDERQNIRLGWVFRKHTGFAPTNSYFAKASRLKNRLKAERAWFLSEEGRRARPETKQLLPRWGKSCAFLNSLARAFLQTVFSKLTLTPSYHGKKDASAQNRRNRGQFYFISIFSNSTFFYKILPHHSSFRVEKNI